MLHKSIEQVTTITIAKREVEQAILEFLELSFANSITMESDGRATIIIRENIKSEDK